MTTTPTPLQSNTLGNQASVPGAVLANPAGVTVDAVNGNTFANSGLTMLYVQNTDASNPHSLTIATVETVGGLGLQADQRSIPASGSGWVGRLNPAVYGSNPVITGPATLKVTVFEP